MQEIYLVKDNTEFVHGFVLTEEDAFRASVQQFLEILEFETDIEQDEQYQEVKYLIDNKEYQKAYYKMRDYWRWDAFKIERVETCQT